MTYTHVCTLTDIPCLSPGWNSNMTACVLLNGSFCFSLSTDDILIEDLRNVHPEEESSPSGVLHSLQLLS